MVAVTSSTSLSYRAKLSALDIVDSVVFLRRDSLNSKLKADSREKLFILNLNIYLNI